MSSRVAIQQFVSSTEPTGVALGDEWYLPSTGLLYKRTAVGGTQTNWVNIAVIPSGGTSTQVLSYGANGALTWATGGGVSGGAAGQVVFMSAPNVTAFSNNLTFNSATGELTCVDINTTSDMNLKDNVSTISNPCNILENIRGVQFNWKESGQLSYGLIAQELEQTLPELVGTNDSGLKSIRYLPLIGILLEAIKAQQAQIDQLIEKIK